MSDVTRILSQIEAGDPQAAEKLLPLVYEELRKLAAGEALTIKKAPHRPSRQRKGLVRPPIWKNLCEHAHFTA